MRIGYSYWGFTGDYKIKDGREISTPDGNATYSWSIVWEALKRGHQVYMMQQDRDLEAFQTHGLYDFASFSQEKRFKSYLGMDKTNGVSLPELDVLLIEWRFPIPGRNTGATKDDVCYQPDLDRQTELLEHYSSKKTKVVLWDLDHKLTIDDELKWNPDAIFETSVNPRELSQERIRVEPPIVIGDVKQHKMVSCDPTRKLVYVGSRYERDDVIEQYIKPVSDKFPGQVEFYGNWTREETLREVKRMWPNITFKDRICTRDFDKAYNTAVACPLLSKRSYMQTGFITPRVWEALMFGTIPIGFDEFCGIHNYVSNIAPNLIAANADELIEIVECLSKLDDVKRQMMRDACIDQIEFMDVKHFVDKVERIA